MADEIQPAAAPAAGAETTISGPITDTATAVDLIAGLLDDAGDEIKRPDAPAAAAEDNNESPEPGDAALPEGAPSGDDAAGEPAETSLIDPPLSWDEKAKEAFKALPPHLQQTVAEREKARDAEIRRGQNEIAEQRKAVEAEQAKISSERTGYVQQLTSFLTVASQQFQDEFANIDWNRLAADDPAAFVQKKFLFEQKQAAINTAATERARLENEAAEGRKQAQSDYLVSEHKALLEKAPVFADEKKAPEVKAKVVSYLKDKGFTPQEINGLTDHRTMLVILDALEVRSVRENRAKTTAKVAAAPPKVAEPTKPGPSKEEKSSTERAALVRQLGKARTTDQQAKLLASIL
jgi:hypothetical protein